MLRLSSEQGKPLLGNNKYEGYCADLAKKIAEIVLMDYTIQPVKDGKYGGKDENGTWNGIVGEIIRKVSQLCGLHATAPFLVAVGSCRSVFCQCRDVRHLSAANLGHEISISLPNFDQIVHI